VSVRRVVMLVVVAASLAAGVAVHRRAVTQATLSFGADTHQPMPVAALDDSSLTTSWFCPGVPADGADGTDGTVTVVNPGDRVLDGTYTVYPSVGAAVSRPLSVPERGRLDIRAHDLVAAPFAAVLVQLVGGAGLVAETTITKQGIGAAPCANEPSTTWYLAGGSTALGSDVTLLLFNPFPGEAIVNLSIYEDVLRTPPSFQGIVVAPGSMRTITIGEVVQRKPTVSISAVATRGRFVMGRFQSFTGTTRRGIVAGLATPSPGTSWLFADGEKSATAQERLAVYNPGEREATVVATLYPEAGLRNETPPEQTTSSVPATTSPDSSGPLPSTPAPSGPQAQPIPVVVPARGSVTLDLALDADVAAGRYHVVVSSDQPVVVERALDGVHDRGFLAATGLLGSRTSASRWYLPVGAPAGSASSIVVSNDAGVAVTVSVKTLGPAGEVAVAELPDVVVASAGSVKIDVPAAITTQSLVVDARTADGQAADVVVEQRVVPTNPKLLWATSSLGLPVVSR